MLPIVVHVVQMVDRTIYWIKLMTVKIKKKNLKNVLTLATTTSCAEISMNILFVDFATCTLNPIILLSDLDSLCYLSCSVCCIEENNNSYYFTSQMYVTCYHALFFAVDLS